MGYAGEGEVDDVVDAAQQEVYQVTDKRTSEDYAPLSAIMEATLDEIEAISNRGGEMTGVPTGFADLDELTNGLHGGQMVIVAARPAVGKSTLALDLCRAASIHHNQTSVIFSLEMTRNEITMRLLSAEAKIPLNHMRNGHMSDDDWQKLARKMGEVSAAPLFIDDSPNMTMMEIRAKARRLKQRHDLQADRHRLPPADDVGQEGRVPPARGLGVLPADQAAGQGAQRPGHRAVAAQPWSRAAVGQAADAQRPP